MLFCEQNVCICRLGLYLWYCFSGVPIISIIRVNLNSSSQTQLRMMVLGVVRITHPLGSLTHDPFWSFPSHWVCRARTLIIQMGGSEVRLLSIVLPHPFSHKQSDDSAVRYTTEGPGCGETCFPGSPRRSFKIIRSRVNVGLALF